MIGTWTPPVRTPATPVEASRAYREAIKDVTGVAPTEAAVAVLHAQGALETGNFASCWCWGVGNIKAGVKWSGLYTTIKLNEVLKGVTVWFDPLGQLTSRNGTIVPGTESANPPGHAQTRMRAFATMADGVEDKIRFLAGARWRPSLERALAGDPEGYVTAVRAAGYFTAPLEPYKRAVTQLTAKLLPVAIGAAEQPIWPVEEDDQLCKDIAECMRVEWPDWLRAKIRILQADHVDFALEQSRKQRDKDILGS